MTRLEKERSDLWVRLNESEQNRDVASEQLEISKKNLDKAKAEIDALHAQREEQQQKVTELTEQVAAAKESAIPNETTTRVIRAAKKRILALEAELKRLKSQQGLPISKSMKKKSAVNN